MDVPALRDFCVFAAMAIFCDFFFQHTFFPAAILYCDSIKEKHDKVVEKVVKKLISKRALQSPLGKKFFASRSTTEESRSWVAKFCFFIVSSRIGQTLLTITILALTAIAIMGTSRLKPDSSLTK
uniref:SSD domain-containing protein n=1 Tax=Plectus sambesii TaxID=2011161 RepID=A0A914VFN7_9BILA